MRNVTKLIGISLIALILCSVATSSSSAATYSYSLAVGKGAYAKYQCIFSNNTLGYGPSFRNGSSFSYIVMGVNMTWGYTINYASDTHKVEGAYFAFYVNDTFQTIDDTGDMAFPLRLLLTPTSNEWWNLLKSWGENQSVRNKITIGSDKVDVTWFMTNGGNDTFTGSIDEDTGVVLNFKDVYFDFGTNHTYVYQVNLVETNIPNTGQPTSPLLIVGVAGVCAALGLVLGFFVGKRRV